MFEGIASLAHGARSEVRGLNNRVHRVVCMNAVLSIVSRPFCPMICSHGELRD